MVSAMEHDDEAITGGPIGAQVSVLQIVLAAVSRPEDGHDTKEQKQKSTSCKVLFEVEVESGFEPLYKVLQTSA